MKDHKNIEDYLETIYILSEEMGFGKVRIKKLAEILEVYPSTVSEMVKKLLEMGLVIKMRNGSIKLTEIGKERAKQVLKSHRVLECLFHYYLGLDISNIKDAICGIEHHINEEIFNALYEKLGKPKLCPHRKPIPI